jgi:hypothetical protein
MATNPLCSSTWREAGLSSATLARRRVSPYSAAASSRTSRTAEVANPRPAAFCAIRNPSSADPSANFDQVHPPDHLAVFRHQDMEVIGPAGLPFEPLCEPRVEIDEELVAPIRHRRREVGPVLALEGKQGRCVVEAEQLKFWPCHVRTSSNFGGHRLQPNPCAKPCRQLA